MLNRIDLLRAVVLISVVLLAGLVATACAPSAPPGPTAVRATMDEFTIKLSATSAPAGKVTFQVANQGKVEHELVVLKTDLAPNALKMRAANPKKVDEEAGTQNLGEVEDVGAGETKSGTFDLPAGKYVLICNVEDHYKAGMAVAFEVK